MVTTDLVIRSEPGFDDRSQIYPERLQAPTLLYVVDGPVRAGGYDWYLVDPFADWRCSDICPDNPESLPVGWVGQEGKDGEVWVAPASFDCPNSTFDGVAALPPTARLACFGGERLEFDGRIWCNEGAGCALYRDDYDPSLGGIGWYGIDLRFDDDDRVRLGVRVHVSGQFDHPSAAECGPDPELVLTCRGAFVASDIRLRD